MGPEAATLPPAHSLHHPVNHEFLRAPWFTGDIKPTTGCQPRSSSQSIGFSSLTQSHFRPPVFIFTLVTTAAHTAVLHLTVPFKNCSKLVFGVAKGKLDDFTHSVHAIMIKVAPTSTFVSLHLCQASWLAYQGLRHGVL